jgi:hypothetical protein
MARKRQRVVEKKEETRDRKAVERWMGDRTLEEAGLELGKRKQWMSEWFRHEVELDDLDVDHWESITGVSRRTFLDGRYDSRKLVERLSGSGAAA